MMSLTALLTDEAKEEVRDLLNSKAYYVGVNGRMVFSLATDVVNLTIANLTGDPG
jgi:hypothetical protein